MRLAGFDMPDVDDPRLGLAIRAVRGAYDRWSSTPVGDKLTLLWPLPISELEKLGDGVDP